MYILEGRNTRDYFCYFSVSLEELQAKMRELATEESDPEDFLFESPIEIEWMTGYAYIDKA